MLFRKNKKYSILVGSSNIDGAGGTVKPVQKTKNHPQFVSNANDISVLTLKFILHFGKNVQKVILPKRNEKLTAGAKAYVAGFGQTGEGQHQPRKLKGVDVTIFNMGKCKEMMEPYVPKTLCAGNIKGGKGFCIVSGIHPI